MSWSIHIVSNVTLGTGKAVTDGFSKTENGVLFRVRAERRKQNKITEKRR